MFVHGYYKKLMSEHNIRSYIPSHCDFFVNKIFRKQNNARNLLKIHLSKTYLANKIGNSYNILKTKTFLIQFTNSR